LVDTSIDESIDSTPPRRTMKRALKPPSIEVPPEQLKESDKGEDKLTTKMNNILECCALEELWYMELDDKINTLRRALCAKVLDLAEVTRHVDLYNPRMP
jgi:hypothetical protein